VIFDIDGTLIDSVDLHARSWMDTFTHFRVKATLQGTGSHRGKRRPPYPSFVPPGTLKDRIKEIEQYRAELFKRKYLAQVRPFPEVPELFAALKAAGCQLVLASSCSGRELRRPHQTFTSKKATRPRDITTQAHAIQ